MKMLNIVIFMGLVLLYFVNAALKIDLFNWEMFIHVAIRFFTGFLGIGVGYFYEKIQLKLCVFIVLGLLIGDDISDAIRHVNNFSIELMLQGIYMLIWGTLVGYFAIKSLKNKSVQ